MAWYSFCSQSTSGCGGVNLGGRGDPSSPSGYRQDYSVPLPVGTGITSPVKGVVLPQHDSGYLSLFGKQDWGGETDILTYLPMYDKSNPVVVTVLHYDTLDKNLKGGAVVDQTSQLGTSGGQTSGGNWPANPKDSSGPHVGIAVRPYNSWGDYYDPTPLMQQLLSGQDPSQYPTIPQLRQSFTGLQTYDYVPSSVQQGITNPFTNPLDAFGQIGTGIAFITNANNWKRLAKIVAGAVLIVIGVMATIFGPALPDIAAAGVTAAGVPEAATPVVATLRGRQRRGVLRAAIRTAGAVQGQRTLKAREARGTEAEQKHAKAKRQASARQGATTRQREREAGVPPRTIRNPARQAFERTARTQREFPVPQAQSGPSGRATPEEEAERIRRGMNEEARRQEHRQARNPQTAARRQQQEIDRRTRERGHDAVRRAREEFK